MNINPFQTAPEGVATTQYFFFSTTPRDDGNDGLSRTPGGDTLSER